MSKKRVMIGMSGGVDSSVAAYLLKQQGYEVIGVHMKLWQEEEETEEDRRCCSISAVEDARKVCAKIDIPFYVFNMKDIFRKKVVDYFIEEYFKGKTPNPCIACNKHIKFDAFLKKAKALDCDFVATGHYTRISFDDKYNRYVLKKSETDEKDQTYALYNITQDQIKNVLTPLGDYTKDQIRKIASEIGLITANKPDSQEICFVEKDNYVDFLKTHSDKKISKGNFVDKEGKILGKHEGIVNYTIGQRKGLGIALGKPAYVLGIDAKTNKVIIGENQDLFKKTVFAEDINLILFEEFEEGLCVEAKIRYNAKPQPAKMYHEKNGKIKIIFEEAQRAVTPGQSLVIYKDEYVVGGGIITLD